MTAFAGATFLQDLAFGFTQFVGDAGIGFTWRPDADYAADECAGFVADIPDTPDWMWACTPYPLSADPQLSNSTWGVQFRYRGHPGTGWTDVASMSSALRGLLRNRFVITDQLPEVDPSRPRLWVSHLVYSNGGSLGQDGRRRWQWQDSFTCSAYEPGTYTK